MTLRGAAQRSLPWDICAGRHGHSPTSMAANPDAERKRASHAAIMALFSGGRLMTSKQIAVALDRPLHCISGRITELVRLGLLERVGRRVEGAELLSRPGPEAKRA